MDYIQSHIQLMLSIKMVQIIGLGASLLITSMRRLFKQVNSSRTHNQHKSNNMLLNQLKSSLTLNQVRSIHTLNQLIPIKFYLNQLTNNRHNFNQLMGKHKLNQSMGRLQTCRRMVRHKIYRSMGKHQLCRLMGKHQVHQLKGRYQLNRPISRHQLNQLNSRRRLHRRMLNQFMSSRLRLDKPTVPTNPKSHQAMPLTINGPKTNTQQQMASVFNSKKLLLPLDHTIEV